VAEALAKFGQGLPDRHANALLTGRDIVPIGT
jgi:hypothetical protein